MSPPGRSSIDPSKHPIYQYFVERARSRAQPAPKSKVHTITLRLKDIDKISFETVERNYCEHNDEHGRGNDPTNYNGRYLAFIRITDSEPVATTNGKAQHVTSLHVMLSDRNILRLQDPNGVHWRIENSGDRVYYAILGTVLTQCDSRHVLDSREFLRSNRTAGYGDYIEKFAINRHEFWKMFQAIRPPVEDTLVGLKVYNLQSYSAAETQELLRSAYARATTFSIEPVSEARRRAYLKKATRLGRGEPRYRAHGPEKLIGLAGQWSVRVGKLFSCVGQWEGMLG